MERWEAPCEWTRQEGDFRQSGWYTQKQDNERSCIPAALQVTREVGKKAGGVGGVSKQGFLGETQGLKWLMLATDSY